MPQTETDWYRLKDGKWNEHSSCHKRKHAQSTHKRVRTEYSSAQSMHNAAQASLQGLPALDTLACCIHKAHLHDAWVQHFKDCQH
eukprot:1160090-Pelagomonas_calceolata.AAC.3